MIDRPVELVFREVEGLPKGSVKAVIDAYGELVDEGCLAVFGPHITDNCVPTREAIERRFEVPAISVTGSDDWLGEWTFSLPQGSLTDEPIFWADLVAKSGHAEVGALVEQSLVGETYIRNFRKACRATASGSRPRSGSPRPPRTSTEQVRSLFEAKARVRPLRVRVRPCPRQPGAGGARSGTRLASSGTAFQNAWIQQVMWDAIQGWTGLDQYDEAEPRRAGVSRRVPGGLRPPARVLRPGGEP